MRLFAYIFLVIWFIFMIRSLWFNDFSKEDRKYIISYSIKFSRLFHFIVVIVLPPVVTFGILIFNSEP